MILNRAATPQWLQERKGRCLQKTVSCALSQQGTCGKLTEQASMSEHTFQNCLWWAYAHHKTKKVQMVWCWVFRPRNTHLPRLKGYFANSKT